MFWTVKWRIKRLEKKLAYCKSITEFLRQRSTYLGYLNLYDLKRLIKYEKKIDKFKDKLTYLKGYEVHSDI
jgi:hypothetical protein